MRLRAPRGRLLGSRGGGNSGARVESEVVDGRTMTRGSGSAATIIQSFGMNLEGSRYDYDYLSYVPGARSLCALYRVQFHG